jgi:hypothetical protein
LPTHHTSPWFPRHAPPVQGLALLFGVCLYPALVAGYIGVSQWRDLDYEANTLVYLSMAFSLTCLFAFAAILTATTSYFAGAVCITATLLLAYLPHAPNSTNSG